MTFFDNNYGTSISTESGTSKKYPGIVVIYGPVAEAVREDKESAIMDCNAKCCGIRKSTRCIDHEQYSEEYEDGNSTSVDVWRNSSQCRKS